MCKLREIRKLFNQKQTRNSTRCLQVQRKKRWIREMPLPNDKVYSPVYVFHSLQILEGFPETLQNDVCYHLRQDLFESVSAFKEADKACLRSLAMKFRTSYYLPDQCIIRQGDIIQDIYFIASGIVEITRDGRSLLSLGM